MQPSLPQAIEAILFATGEAQSISFLAKVLNTDAETVESAIKTLETLIEGHGIALTRMGGSVALTTTAAVGTLIEQLRKDELSKELTKASAETLAIIAYTPGVSKAQIEFIRGVNVSYSLRALMMRGLIESKGQGRAIGYFPSLQLLEQYGITSIEQLPDYATTKAKIDTLLQSAEITTNTE